MAHLRHGDLKKMSPTKKTILAETTEMAKKSKLHGKSMLAKLATTICPITLLFVSACGGGNLLEPYNPTVRMLEYDTEVLSVRYTDEDGFPIQAANCRFTKKGDATGAELTERAALTDEQGDCRVSLRAKSSGVFNVLVSADGAAHSATITINVSNDVGGKIEAVVSTAAEASIREAQVLLTEDMDCNQVEPFLLPTVTKNALNPLQRTPMTVGTASTVTISGLKPNISYTLIVTGMSEDQTVGFGCRENIVLTQEQIDQRKEEPIAMHISDMILPGIAENALTVTTVFEKLDIGLAGVAGKLAMFAGDDQYGPAGYVLGQMQAKAAESDDEVEQFIAAYASTLKGVLGGQTSKVAQAALAKAARELKSVEDVQMITSMELLDEAPNPEEYPNLNLSHVDLTEPTLHHKFHYFTAKVEGKTRKYIIRSKSLNIAGETVEEPVLENFANYHMPNAQDFEIDGHTMSAPMMEAIAGSILMNNFGDFDIEDIITPMIDCSALSQKVANMVTSATGSSSNGWIQALQVIGNVSINVALYNMCVDEVQDVIQGIVSDLAEKLEKFRIDKEMIFEGSAYMMRGGDQNKIQRLTDGEWVALAGSSFTARR